MQQKSAGDDIVASFKSEPAKLKDKATLGPQRRSLSQKVGDEYNQMKTAAKKQWGEFKELTSKPAAKKYSGKN